MGYTHKTWEVLKPHLKAGMSVLDFGAQNDYARPYHEYRQVKTFGLRPPYVSEAYKRLGIDYTSIDLNRENNCLDMDLSTEIDLGRQFDLVSDAGTKEHVHNLLAAFKNQYNLIKVGGLMYCENPKTGSWNLHGFHFFDQDFYIQLAIKAEMDILVLEDHAAMGNTIDGWNVICLLRKNKEGFVNELPKTYTE